MKKIEKEVIITMKLESVKDYFSETESVEKYNKEKIKKLKWECPDVLFSFKGIYSIGVFIYYRKEFVDNVNIDIIVKNESGKSKQRLYSDNFLRENYTNYNKVNELKGVKEFLEHYYDIGNVIPTWPGANVNRGMAHCYDIPDIYYNRYKKFAEFVYKNIYKNVFIEDIFINSKYDSVDKILKMTQQEYDVFLKYVVKIIKKRNILLNEILKDEMKNRYI